MDARGKPCPWPIIELAKALRSHETVELLADDPGTEPDLLAFCASTGARLERIDRDSGGVCALVRGARKTP